jgi:hypothetical protein
MAIFSFVQSLFGGAKPEVEIPLRGETGLGSLLVSQDLLDGSLTFPTGPNSRRVAHAYVCTGDPIPGFMGFRWSGDAYCKIGQSGRPLGQRLRSLCADETILMRQLGWPYGVDQYPNLQLRGLVLAIAAEEHEGTGYATRRSVAIESDLRVELEQLGMLPVSGTRDWFIAHPQRFVDSTIASFCGMNGIATIRFLLDNPIPVRDFGMDPGLGAAVFNDVRAALRGARVYTRTVERLVTEAA